MDPLRGHLLLSLRLGPLPGSALPGSALRVRSVRGSEAVSSPFRFEVQFFPISGEELELAPLLAAEAAISMARPDGTTRWIHGICAAAELTGVAAGRPSYRAIVVPRLALLGETADSRVFQGKSAVEIVKELLDAHQVAHREALAGTSPPREMCIQYRESDLAFAARLLEEEGIAYWFEHAEDRHVMVLSDQPEAFAPLEGGESIPFRAEREHGVDLEHLQALRASRRVTPAKASLRDYDFERPALPVSAEASQGSGAEVYDWPAGAIAPPRVAELGRIRLEELRVTGEMWQGEGTCARLVPGGVFAADDHPDPAFRGRLVAVQVEHSGEQPAELDAAQVTSSYRSRFVAIPQGTPYRPPRTTPRPRIAGIQTAVVVGPPGEEIHPDRHGRIKVQFRWDRKGKRDERSSAWVRTAQAWGGPGFGALFVPRAGHEVVVRFLEGDPDRPLVIGTLYNGENLVGAELPREKTQSYLRTDSVPHTDGFSELRFEDLQGAEEIYLRAQKDELLETERDKEQHVLAHEQLEVANDRSKTVGGSQRLEVHLDDLSDIGGDRALAVGSNREVVVSGAHAEAIEGEHAATVGGSRDLTIQGQTIETIGAASTLTVGAAYAVSVAGAENLAIGGALRREVARDVREWVGGTRDVEVRGDDIHRIQGKDVLDVRGSAYLVVERDLTETVANVLEAEARGPVAWDARTIAVEAERVNLVVGGQRLLSLGGGQVTFSASCFSASATAIALRGSSIAKLGPAPPPSAAPKVKKLRKLAPGRALVRVRVTDKESGKPLINVRVRVEMPDGTVQVVRSDEEGLAVASAPRHGRVKVSLVDHEESVWDKR